MGLARGFRRPSVSPWQGVSPEPTNQKAISTAEGLLAVVDRCLTNFSRIIRWTTQQ
jgi:hypothetical protein